MGPHHDPPAPGDRVALRGATLALLLIALAILAETRTASLLAWTERVVPISRYPALFACFFATWVLVRTSESRRGALLFGSLATGLVFDPGFLAIAVAWVAAFYRILFGGADRPRVRAAVAFTLATYAGLAVLGCNTEHSYLPRWAYVFAVSFTFRLAWLLHEVRMRRRRIPFADVLLYFVFAPFFVIVPYMIAIPRSDKFRAGLDRHDLAVERSGLRMIAWGIALALAGALAYRIHDPRAAFVAAAQRHDVAATLANSLLYYPLATVLDVAAISAILVGLVRVLGIDLAPAFDAPLLARDVAEWWRRWNTHFRDLLVDLFYYPALMRHRRNPDRAILVGCAMTFLAGSMLFHLPKFFLRRGSFDTPPLGLFVENLLMCAIVAAILIRRRRRPQPPAAEPVAVRARRMIATWIVVMLTVVGAGYGAQALVQPEPTPQAWWSSAY